MSGCSGLMSGCLRNCRPDTPEYAINSQIKKEVVFFVYPWGQLNYFNSKIVSVVKYIGYDLACSTLW